MTLELYFWIIVCVIAVSKAIRGEDNAPTYAG